MMRKPLRRYPSTSSGRAGGSHGLVFTTEPVEVSGRAGGVVLVFTATEHNRGQLKKLLILIGYT